MKPSTPNPSTAAPPQPRASTGDRAWLLPLALFIPLGLLMDFVHELGHALAGVALGGTLTHMQVTYLIVYPGIALTPQFCLGCVQVRGLIGAPDYGLVQLAGSTATNIMAWLLAAVLIGMNLGRKNEAALKLLGVWGLLDLPLYVFLPQMGLRHWIILGGEFPEPLVGARKMGIPDPAFYFTVLLTTFGLLLVYVKPLWEKAFPRVRSARRKT